MELSIGDYVLTGGELACDGYNRLRQQALFPACWAAAESAEDESFSDGLLEYPQYTRPAVFRDMAVPEVLLNGNHALIAQMAAGAAAIEAYTIRQRPELIDENIELSKKEITFLQSLKRMKKQDKQA